MNERIAKDLNLERYASLLQRAAGDACPVALCDATGHPVWSTDGSEGSQIEGAIRELNGLECVFSSASGVQRIDFGAGESLLTAPVERAGEEPAAWLALLVQREMAANRVAAAEGTLLDLAACLSTEYALNQEANGLATELSGRYEELNLLYSMEAHVRAFEQGAAGVQALLQNLAERIDIDLAAFVVSSDSRPLHATPGARKLDNQDLVLTALAGDLFRFVCTSRKALVLNAPDDPRRGYLFANMSYRVLACPVVDLGTQNAMMVFVRRENAPEFTNGDRSLAKVIANQTAIMLQNYTMLGRFQRFGEQIAQSLIAAIEAKDPYTRGHSERVQEISVKIGRAAGLSANTIEDISWGALLHDVGKIGIPESIICKAGRLTEDEYTMIKTHPERSFEILRHIDHLSRGSLDAARYHHERVDGAGYPGGLIGKAIPVEARVIAIGDTYDAVTSSRSYRAAQGHDAALRIIQDAAGSQLDADLVLAFEKMCESDADWIETESSDEKARE